MKHRVNSVRSLSACSAACLFLVSATALAQRPYVIVDTAQTHCYDNDSQLGAMPVSGDAFYGQDANYPGVAPSYQDNGDGTVTDLNTGLMWQKTPDFANKTTWAAAPAVAANLVLGGHDDWRLPTIKELYSLMAFYGSSFQVPPVPYLDTTYFDFEYPDEASGERLIDCQYWSSTGYVGTTMNNDATAFGVNFADGRIKGYPTETGPGGVPFTAYVRCVRGGNDYGVNDFQDNGDGTITDLATGLMWSKADSATTMNWQQALAYAEGATVAGYDDWRLPDAKELQSIVDYTRAPDATDPSRQGPAIDPIFDITVEESWAWTSTTHLDGPTPDFAVYVCFGRGLSAMIDFFGEQINAHGAGAQRSDPKSGDPLLWSGGNGPQLDEIRIYNFVRLVRTVETCAADASGDGQVDVTDLLSVLSDWGPCPAVCPSDGNDDGQVNVLDLLATLAFWGRCV